MEKRWISMYVENQIGVLAKITGLFSGKNYNLDSISVGETEDKTVSRITMGLTCDNLTYEQILKQLNRSVEVIKVLDFTNMPIHKKELMFIKVNLDSEAEKNEIFRLAQTFKFDVIDYNGKTAVIQAINNDNENEQLIQLFENHFKNEIEVVRSGSIAIERI